MNWADHAILAALGLSMLVGLWRGFVSEVLALVTWIGAFWASWAFGPALAAALPAVVSTPSLRILLGYGGCFVAVLVVGAIALFLMRKLIEGSGLSTSDRLLGMGFGLARGAVLVVLAVLLLQLTPLPADPWWSESRLLPGFSASAAWLGKQLPEEVTQYLHQAHAALVAPVLQPAPEIAPPQSPPI